MVADGQGFFSNFCVQGVDLVLDVYGPFQGRDSASIDTFAFFLTPKGGFPIL